MSLNKLTKPTLPEGNQTLLPSLSSLTESGEVLSNEINPVIIRFESDDLPERFQAALPPIDVVKPGETDNTFVREQPW